SLNCIFRLNESTSRFYKYVQGYSLSYIKGYFPNSSELASVYLQFNQQKACFNTCGNNSSYENQLKLFILSYRHSLAVITSNTNDFDALLSGVIVILCYYLVPLV